MHITYRLYVNVIGDTDPAALLSAIGSVPMRG
jgi:hypothetical protein